MKQIITRLDPHLLREMCIRRKYYTKGDNKAYSSMLYRYEAEENLLAEEIFDLAEDIKAHSNTEAEVESIAYQILKEATYQLFAEK